MKISKWLLAGAFALVLPSLAMAAKPAPAVSDQTVVVPTAPQMISRTLQSHFIETLDIKDFGAVGDGVTDDTAAIQAAYTAAAAACATKDVALSVPPGRYMISAWNPAITCQHDLAVTGAGPGMSSLVFANSDGFDFTATQNGVSFRLSGLRLLNGNTATPYSGTAVTVISPQQASGNSTFFGRDLVLGDAQVDQNYGWNVGFNLTATTNSTLDNVQDIKPNWSTTTGTSGIGVKLQGYSANEFSIGFHSHFFTDQGGYAAIVGGAFIQGIDVNQGAFVGEGYGVHWDGTTPGDVAEGLTVFDSELNAAVDDIWLNQVTEDQVIGNNFLELGTTPNWRAVLETASGYSTINDNTIYGAGANSSAVEIANCSGCNATIVGNAIAGLHGVGITLSGTTSMVTASGNQVNGPSITAPYSEANPGQDMLGELSYNSMPAATRYDGVHFDLLQPMAVNGPNGTSYLGSDGASGIHISKAGGSSGSLTVDGGVAAPSGTISAINLSSLVGGSFETADSTGTSGFIQADGAGGLLVGTLRTGGVPNFTLGSGGRFGSPLTTPASSSAACAAGQHVADANYIYVCTATNTWKRAALSAF